MTTGKTTEHFLELEAQANELLDGLARLKQEATHYSQAAETLLQVSEKVSGLVDPLENLTEGLRDAVAGLRELGVGDLVDRTSELERLLKGLEEARARSDQRASRMAAQLDSLMEYQSKGLLGRLFGKPQKVQP